MAADFHCITRLDDAWEGVSSYQVMQRIEPLPEATFCDVIL